jgi:3',5'-nucleoside bisphosphate phosphatase
MLDLHCHSLFSDGLLSPKELVLQAVANNVRVLALTDHDTLDGVPFLLDAARDYPELQIINGIELSTRWKKYDIHIVGLKIQLDDPMLCDLIIEQNLLRINRAKQIGHLLSALGVEDGYEKACQIAGHMRAGRPHFAQVLVNEGLVPDLQTAFKKFLGSGRCAYVATSWVDFNRVIEAINHAGGQAVIAHPLKYDFTRTKLRELISDFKLAGGVGIEIIAGDLPKTQILEMVGLAMRYDLLASTGSDYHGPKISRVGLGRQPIVPAHCKPLWIC